MAIHQTNQTGLDPHVESGLETPPVMPPDGTNRPHPLLFQASVAIALAFAAALLVDGLAHHRILQFVAGLEWYILFGLWWTLVFLLAELLAELLRFMFPVVRAWDQDERLEFTVIFCIFGCFAMPGLYVVMIFLQVQTYPGN